jgi:predicted helicase
MWWLLSTYNMTTKEFSIEVKLEKNGKIYYKSTSSNLPAENWESWGPMTLKRIDDIIHLISPDIESDWCNQENDNTDFVIYIGDSLKWGSGRFMTSFWNEQSTGSIIEAGKLDTCFKVYAELQAFVRYVKEWYDELPDIQGSYDIFL